MILIVGLNFNTQNHAKLYILKTRISMVHCIGLYNQIFNIYKPI
jgi:hypothetical protein